MLMDKLSRFFINTPFRRWFLDRATKKNYFEYFNELRNKSVLEIGCGSGLGTGIILKYFSPQKIIATDLDSRLIATAKKNIQAKEITFEEADATKLNYKDESFDGVFDYGAIHHIPFPEWTRCLKEIYRVLKSGGKVFIYDVSIESFNTLYGKIIRLTSAHPYDRMYRKKEFINYLSEIGFKIIYKAEESRYFAIVADK